MKILKPHLILPSGEVFFLEGNTSIGRSENCSIRLEGPKVSREHTHIYEIGGKFQVVDSQSRNGTYLNEVWLRRPTTLKNGDRITVGGHELIFKDGTSVEIAAEVRPNLTVTIEELVQVPAWLLLADIKDSTRLTTSMGLEKYSALLGKWFKACSSIVEEHGGVVNQSTGDGFLAYWKDDGSETAERIAVSLVHLNKIQKMADPQFRIVVHYGKVGFGGGARVGEEPLTGQDVHYVFRIEKALGTTACLLGATERTIPFLKDLIKHEEIAKVSLKGFEGDHSLFALLPEQPLPRMPLEY